MKLVRIIGWPIRKLLIRPVRAVKRTAETAHAVYQLYQYAKGEKDMTPAQIIEIVRILYSRIFRPLLKERIERSPQQWDDLILQLCDKLFGVEDSNA